MHKFCVLQGVIRTREDLEQLGPDFKEAYKPHELDPLDDVTGDSQRK